jgi:hypothetical protein
VYRFGVFELDSRARELKKQGVRIKLQDQPLRILLLLVEHSGEVVTREQIQSQLWPAGTYVDYENAINSSVRKLPEALSRSVYFIQESQAPVQRSNPFSSRSAETIAPLVGTDYWGFTLSPDERVALYSRLEVVYSELMLIEDLATKNRP